MKPGSGWKNKHASWTSLYADRVCVTGLQQQMDVIERPRFINLLQTQPVAFRFSPFVPLSQVCSHLAMQRPVLSLY